MKYPVCLLLALLCLLAMTPGSFACDLDARAALALAVAAQRPRPATTADKAPTPATAATAKRKSIRRKAPPCSSACTCGCQDGEECRCNDTAPASPAVAPLSHAPTYPPMFMQAPAFMPSFGGFGGFGGGFGSGGMMRGGGGGGGC